LKLTPIILRLIISLKPHHSNLPQKALLLMAQVGCSNDRCLEMIQELLQVEKNWPELRAFSNEAWTFLLPQYRSKLQIQDRSEEGIRMVETVDGLPERLTFLAVKDERAPYDPWGEYQKLTFGEKLFMGIEEQPWKKYFVQRGDLEEEEEEELESEVEEEELESDDPIVLLRVNTLLVLGGLFRKVEISGALVSLFFFSVDSILNIIPFILKNYNINT
jgi:hypothetical protein